MQEENEVRGHPLSRWPQFYRAVLQGEDLAFSIWEELGRASDDIWDAGPEAVAEEIARIEAEFELRQRIADVEADQIAFEDGRHGIGGNNPPVEIDDPELAEPVVMMWESIAGLKEEVEAEEPDPSRVQALIAALGRALGHVLAWCGRKADLAVDTTIKYVIPAGGAAYFLLNPAKAEAVLKAAQEWLPFLAP